MIRGIAEITCDRFSEKEQIKVAIRVPRDIPLKIRVNGEDIITTSCTPMNLEHLVIGFLYTEGMISELKDIIEMKVSEEEGLADVKLKSERESRKLGEVKSALTVSAAEILSLIKEFLKEMQLQSLSGGVHASALCDPGRVLVVAEDIGRHNTLDKIQGECMLKGIATKDRLLLTTARFSPQMLLKAARMEIPVVVSRHPPPLSSISLARELGITLVGHRWEDHLLVYTHAERISAEGGNGDEGIR